MNSIVTTLQSSIVVELIMVTIHTLSEFALKSIQFINLMIEIYLLITNLVPEANLNLVKRQEVHQELATREVVNQVSSLYFPLVEQVLSLLHHQHHRAYPLIHHQLTFHLALKLPKFLNDHQVITSQRLIYQHQNLNFKLHRLIKTLSYCNQINFRRPHPLKTKTQNLFFIQIIYLFLNHQIYQHHQMLFASHHSIQLQVECC